MPATKNVVLGTVDVPSGTLLILDPGLGDWYRHDEDPRRTGEKEKHDYRIVGPDAAAAAAEWGIPGEDIVFDRPETFGVRWGEFCQEHGLHAEIETLPRQMTHAERVAAIANGPGVGVAYYDLILVPVISGLPTDRPLQVTGRVFEDGEFAGRFRSVAIEVSDAAIVRKHALRGPYVDKGMFMCVDSSAIAEFKARQSRDGRADFVFWGPDADALATRFGARIVPGALGRDGDGFGWKDVPVEDIGDLANPVQEYVQENELSVGLDYRPHCRLEELTHHIRTSVERTGTIALEGARTTGFDNRWGDGIFDVVVDYDAADNIVQIRMDVGNKARQKFHRAVLFHRAMIIVTKLATDAVPMLAYRSEPAFPQDSGWLLATGAEAPDDRTAFEPWTIGLALKRWPELAQILETKGPCGFAREGGSWVEIDP